MASWQTLGTILEYPVRERERERERDSSSGRARERKTEEKGYGLPYFPFSMCFSAASRGN